MKRIQNSKKIAQLKYNIIHSSVGISYKICFFFLEDFIFALIQLDAERIFFGR